MTVSLCCGEFYFFFFLMIRRPPRSTLFPSPTLFRSTRAVATPVLELSLAAWAHATRPGDDAGSQVFGTTDPAADALAACWRDRKSTRLNSSHANISYAVFCLKKKKNTNIANCRSNEK